MFLQRMVHGLCCRYIRCLQFISKFYDLYPNFGIPILVNKSLITVDQNGTLSMHDLIQQMGKEVVRQESPKILGKRSRLWYYKDVLEVLTRSKV